MSADARRNGDSSHRFPSRTESLPDYAFWRDGLKELSWRDVAFDLIRYRSGGEIVAIAAIVALYFVASGFIHNRDNDPGIHRLIGPLAVAGMIFILGLSGLIVATRRKYAQNAEQSKGGAAESGDWERSPRENGRTAERDRCAKLDGRGQ
jgi:hypothetical protein